MSMKKTLVEKDVVVTKVVQVPTYTIEFTEEQAAILMYLFGKMRGGTFNSLDGCSIFSWLQMNLPREVVGLVDAHTDLYWKNLHLSVIDGVSYLSDDLKKLAK